MTLNHLKGGGNWRGNWQCGCYFSHRLKSLMAFKLFNVCIRVYVPTPLILRLLLLADAWMVEILIKLIDSVVPLHGCQFVITKTCWFFVHEMMKSSVFVLKRNVVVEKCQSSWHFWAQQIEIVSVLGSSLYKNRHEYLLISILW